MKAIALFDHLSGGHHFAFIRLFTKYLVKLNYRVLLFYPEATKVFASFHEEDNSVRQNVIPIDVDIKETITLRYGRFNDAISALSLWRRTANIINAKSKKVGVKVDLVFIAWLDSYLANYLPYQFVDLVFRYRWSGLFFHPWYLYDNPGARISFSSRDSVLMSRRLINVAIHDEFLCENLKIRIGKSPVVFPEIADKTPPRENFHLAQEIRNRKEGRIAIGLIGLSKRKGLLGLIKLIEAATSDRFYFFLAGEIPWAEYKIDEAKIIQSFLEMTPSNVLYYSAYIEEGAEINSVIDALDILYLVYDNFKSSSNYITKAAIFNKPVLSSNKYWMAAVTKKYNLGAVTDYNNTHQMVSELEELAESKLKGTSRSLNAEYLEIHGEENLLKAFEEVLST